VSKALKSDILLRGRKLGQQLYQPSGACGAAGADREVMSQQRGLLVIDSLHLRSETERERSGLNRLKEDRQPVTGSAGRACTLSTAALTGPSPRRRPRFAPGLQGPPPKGKLTSEQLLLRSVGKRRSQGENHGWPITQLPLRLSHE